MREFIEHVNFLKLASKWRIWEKNNEPFSNLKLVDALVYGSKYFH